MTDPVAIFDRVLCAALSLALISVAMDGNLLTYGPVVMAVVATALVLIRVCKVLSYFNIQTCEG